MTARRLPRRLVVGATSAALLAGVVGVVPLLGSASAACTPTYTDPAGDAVLIADGLAVPSGPDFGNDPDLDLLDITHTVDGGVFRSVVHVAGLADFGPQVSFVETFATSFTVNGKAVTVSATRDHNTDPETDSGVLTVAGTDTTVPVKVLVDLKASTVTSEIAAPAFETALGGALAGKPFSAMSAKATQVFELLGLGGPSYDNEQDAATAPATAAYAFGASCSGSTTTPSGSATPTPTASPTTSPSTPATTGGLYDQPRKGCATFKDPAGDADPSGTGLDNEPALDITQVNLKSPTGALQVFVKLDDPSAGLFPLFSGPVYSAAFTVAGKAVTVTASETGPATATVAGKDSTDVKATAKTDATNKNIVFTIPLDGLSKAVGATVKAGTPITGTKADTAADSDLGPQPADTATGTAAAEKTYAYGDNTCFKPPAGVFVLDADRSGQYGDVTELFATLNDADGSPVQGAKVTAVLTGGRPVSVRTDNDGIADLRLPLLLPAGTKTITVTFAGDSEVGPARATRSFALQPERAVLRLSAVRGGARATLVDDDRPRAHALAGRYVVFVVGSSRHWVKTGSTGVATLTGVRRGTAVKAYFPGVRGYYYGTPASTVRAL